MRAGDDPPAARAGAIAARQHGVVARAQLLEAGVAPATITRWVDAGHLFRLYRGVFAAGNPQLTREGRWMAAVLAGGAHTFLSHRSAAEALGIVRPASGRLIHLTSSVRVGRSLAGTLVHRPRQLEPEDVTRWRGIPATTAARTLFDLATTMTPRLLRRAFEQAEYKEVLDRSRLAKLCARGRGHRGTDAVRALIVEPHLPLERTRSGPERLFLEICRDFGVRIPAVNVPLLEYEVDFYWEREQLVVEIDGGHHERPEQRDRDHEKDARLGRAGILVRRFRRVALRRRAAVAAEVIDTLAERGPAAG